MKNLFLRFLREEDGQTTVEYVLIIVLVAMIVVKISKKIDTNLNESLNSAFGKINSFIGGIE